LHTNTRVLKTKLEAIGNASQVLNQSALQCPHSAISAKPSAPQSMALGVADARVSELAEVVLEIAGRRRLVVHPHLQPQIGQNRNQRLSVATRLHRPIYEDFPRTPLKKM